MRHLPFTLIQRSFLSLIVLTLLLYPSLIFSQDEQKEKEEKSTVITEEILVLGEALKDRPVSTVTILDRTQIERMKPLDLSEAIRYAPGVAVTFGDKSVYTLKLRGLDARRIALLIDGIPVYEPYFSSFDLKTVAADGIDSLQLTKGPSSVLYGPNTLGGIVNVITQRPSGEPELSIQASYGELNTRKIGLKSGFQLKRITLTGNLLYQDSDGFYYPGESNGSRTRRNNSEYQRLNFSTKLHYAPSDQTEFLFNAGIYLSEYSMPPQIEASRARYWRFKNWDRYSFNAGGYTALGQDSMLRFRVYAVLHDNTLAMFGDSEMTQLRFESTHDNAVYGMFALADLSLSPSHDLKVSMNYKGDTARTQDDRDAPWNEYDQLTFSFGVEDHFTILDQWQLVAGVSYDYLDKFTGENTSRINPLLGVKYSPSEPLNLHISFSKKSKFPSMRAMYSSPSGNPDLLSETGTLWELGFSYEKDIFITGSLFLTSFKDMIDSVRLPQFDFQRRYFNVAEAHINGLEFQLQKTIQKVSLTVNYTFLDHKNETDDRPLDALPQHNFNFDLQVFPAQQLRLGVLGLLASASSWLDFTTDESLDIPAYFNLDAVAAYSFDQVELFVKITNMLNNFIYTEPGFPWRSRYIEVGIRADIL